MKINTRKFKLSLLCLFLITSLCGCGGEYSKNQSEFKPSLPPVATDSPSFPGKRTNYTITRTTNGLIIRDNVGTAGSTTISGVNSLRFADMTLNLKIAEKASTIASKDLNSLIDLYIAFFNRVPDADGLAYWIDQFKAGMSLDQIAQSFYSAALLYSTQTGYSASMTNEDFVKIIYKNVLGRSGSTAPPTADVQYWANELKNGRSKSSLISVMLVSARSFANDATWGWVTTLLNNKVSIANYFAVEQGINYNTPEESIRNTIAIVAAITPIATDVAKNLIGVNDSGFNLRLPAAIDTVKKVIFAGYGHSMAIKRDGTLWAWGDNWAMQLCLGDTSIRTVPTLVSSISNAIDVAAGMNKTLVLRSDGSVWECQHSKPEQIAGLSNIVSISLDYALAKDGTLWKIGLFSHSIALSDVVSIASTGSYTMALKKDGTVWTVGENIWGQLGFGDTARRNLFAHSSNFDGAIAVAVGGDHGLAIKKDGSVHAAGLLWTLYSVGSFTYSMTAMTPVPTSIQPLSGIIELAAGGSTGDAHILALKNDGSVWAWGAKFNGATGLGTMESDTAQPSQVPQLNNITAISAGRKHSIALKSDGTLWVSGSNDTAQLGIGKSTNTFIQIPGWNR